MTKEEAIKYLQQLYPNGGHCWLDDQRIEAIGMAIEALQEEPVRDGLVSRKEDCLGCDRRRLEIVTIKNTDGESVDVYMCRGLLDIPCPKGHG